MEVGRASGSEGVTRWGYLWTASPSLAPPFFSEGRGSCSSSSSSPPPLLWLSLSSPLIAAGGCGCPPFLSRSLSRLTPQLPAVPFTSNMMTRATVSVRETGSSTTTQHARARTGGKIKSVADECVSAASVDKTRLASSSAAIGSMDGCGWPGRLIKSLPFFTRTNQPSGPCPVLFLTYWSSANHQSTSQHEKKPARPPLIQYAEAKKIVPPKKKKECRRTSFSSSPSNLPVRYSSLLL